MKNAILSFVLFLSLAFVAAFDANAQINPKFRIAADKIDAQGNLIQAFYKTETEAPTLAEALADLKQRNKITGRNELRLVGQETDEYGVTHYRYQQYFAGIPVDLAEYLLHARNGKVLTMNGETAGVPEETQTEALVSPSKAFDLAVRQVGAQKYSWELRGQAPMRTEKPQAKLVFVRKPATRDAAESFQLAYRLEILSVEPIGKKAIFISARSEKVVAEQPLMADGCAKEHHHTETAETCEETHAATTAASSWTGTAQTVYSGSRNIETQFNGNNFFLFDESRNIHTYNMNNGTDYNLMSDLTDNDNNWTWAEHHENRDDIALDAHWATERSQEYFLGRHNRQGYDGLGSVMEVFVHYGVKYDNANAGGGGMIFGDGNGVSRRHFAALDVVAHEYGHNVCEKTANLIYQNESGALNEAFSDIWGACVEAYAAPEKNHWFLGEEVAVSGSPFRSMKNPNVKFQPDTYLGTFWTNTTDDNGGVHTNSGVLNYWFYLLSEGGSGTNDNGLLYEVAGIGMIKAAKIAYYMERYILGPTSNYSVINSAAQLAALILYGNGSPEHQAVKDALDAVGLGASNFCVSRGMNADYEYIQKVALNGVEIVSGNDGGYANHTNSTFTVTGGNYYTLSMAPGHPVADYLEAWRVWIDFNKDGVFGENELVAANSGTHAVSNNIYIPETASEGYTRMRVSMSYYNPATSPCATFEWGEVEDFTVSILKKTCAAASNNNSYEHIKMVYFNGLYNVSAANSNGYGDYTYLSTNCRRSSAYALVVQAGFSGNAYPEYWKGWIDYNNDGDFNDSGELVLDQFGSYASLTQYVTIPSVVSLGPKRMRIVMSYDPIGAPCGNYAWGEVEDYKINIISSMGLDETSDETPETHMTDVSFETVIDDNTVKTPRNTLSAVDQATENIDFKLAPNPSNGLVSILAEQTDVKEAQLDVFSSDGRFVFTRTIDSNNQIQETIDLSDQPDGLYMVRLRNGTTCKVKTVVLKKQ